MSNDFWRLIPSKLRMQTVINLESSLVSGTDEIYIIKSRDVTLSSRNNVKVAVCMYGFFVILK
jgi:hypothetical protein